MKDPILVLVAIFALAGLYVLVPIFLDVYRRYRNRQAVDCPEKGKQASVRLDARLAALTSLSGHQKLRVKECSLLQHGEDCDQECLSQVS